MAGSDLYDLWVHLARDHYSYVTFDGGSEEFPVTVNGRIEPTASGRLIAVTTPGVDEPLRFNVPWTPRAKFETLRAWVIAKELFLVRDAPTPGRVEWGKIFSLQASPTPNGMVQLSFELRPTTHDQTV